MNGFKKGLSYDDVLLVPSYSEVLPRDCDTRTKFCNGIELAIPFVSSPMDTVTEHATAIAMALAGGVGVIHKNMTVERQCSEVKRVKRWTNSIIDDPVCVHESSPISDLEKEPDYGTFPVVDDYGKLVGIVSKKDIRLFSFDESTPIRDVMTKDVAFVRRETAEKDALTTMRERRVSKVPVVDEGGVVVGLVTLRDVEKRDEYPLATLDEDRRLVVGAAVSVNDLDRARELVGSGVDFLVIDAAHGDSLNVVNAVLDAKKLGIPVVAGNVSTGLGALRLANAGAAAIRVGQGSGASCSTRIVAGIGVPQLTAVMDAAESVDVPVIADGGIKYSGDVTKAIAAGASTVMLGGLIAGTSEAPGAEVFLDGRVYKEYRGMGSVGAILDHGGERYGISKDDVVSPEGVEGRVPYVGDLAPFLAQMIAGLKKGMGYVGAEDLKELREAEFVEVSAAGLRESHPHDMVVTKSSPNYNLPI